MSGSTSSRIGHNPIIIQGLLSIEDKQDHIFMHLVESAKFNKGKNKVYIGVPGNLIAYACKVSMDKGYEGFLAFDAKTTLIKHYEQSLGQHIFADKECSLKQVQHRDLSHNILKLRLWD